MRSIPDPGFAGDEGAADPALAEALAAYDRAEGAEEVRLRHTALSLLQDSRVLVPVVAMLGEVEYDAQGLAPGAHAIVAFQQVVERAEHQHGVCLAVESVSKNFGGLRAVWDVSFEVHFGQIVALIGPNGAGKSTLFNVVSGIEPPSGGRVLLEGQHPGW